MWHLDVKLVQGGEKNLSMCCCLVDTTFPSSLPREHFRVDITLHVTPLAASKSFQWRSNEDFLFNYNYGT